MPKPTKLKHFQERLSNFGLHTKITWLTFQNHGILNKGDSLRAMALKREVKSSALAPKTKKALTLKLEALIKQHVGAAEKWAIFLEWAKQQNGGTTPIGKDLRRFIRKYDKKL